MSVNLAEAFARPQSEKWKRLDRLAREWGVREGDAAICAVAFDLGGLRAGVYLAGRGELEPRRAGELCALCCGDFMTPFLKEGIDEFLAGFSRVGFGREFGHYLREISDKNDGHFK